MKKKTGILCLLLILVICVTVFSACAHKHEFGEWTVTTEPTCESPGEETRLCEKDNTHTEKRSIAALGHDWDNEFTTDTPATCTAQGSKSKHCSRCGEKKDITAIPALGHNYVWTITTAPTAAEDGIETEVCQNDSSHTRDTRTLHAVGTAGLQFTINSEGTEYTVSGYTGTATVIHIPAFYNDKPVTVIGVSAFENNKSITEVHMKEGIRIIDNRAFYACNYITKITVPNSLEVIGDCAIYACAITEFTIGGNVTKIGGGAFRYSHFTTIIIPLSVTEMGIGAFGNIENLTIFTEHTTKPNLWSYYWNSTNEPEGFYPVYWADEWHTVEGVPAPHTYGEWQVVTAPTCTEKGSERHTCSVCSHYEERNISALGHDWEEEFTIDTPATCTAEGSKSKHCSHCGEKKDTTAIPALGHDWEENFTTDTPATCTEEGSKSKHCSHEGCTEKTEVTAIPALGHNYVWTVTTAPTASEDGVETEVCQNDSSHTRGTRTLHATGTAGLQFTPNGEGTEYTVTGYTGTATVVHIPAFYNGKPVTAIGVSAFEYNSNITEVHMKEGIKVIDNYAFYFCSGITKITVPNSLEVIGDCAIYDCAITEFTIGSNVKKIGMSAFRYCGFTTIIIPLSVAEIGTGAFVDIENLTIFTEHSAKPALWNNHWSSDGKSADSFHPVYWAGNWHIVEGVPAPHSYGEWEEITAPTCTEKGKEKHTCTVCNHSEESDIPALGHDWAEEFTIDTPATCTEDGSKSKHCSRCDEKKDITSIPALGHHWDEEFTVDTPATCTAQGSKSKHCSHEGCTEKIEETIPMLEHTYGEWQELTAPTCTEKGKEKRTCTVCGHVEERDIDALGHHWAEEFTIDTPATCTEDGSKSKHCSRCDEKKDITSIPALGHHWDEEFTVDTPATCTAQGSKSKHCSHEGCDEKTEVTAIPMLEHIYGEWQEVTAPTCTEKGKEKRTCSLCGHVEERDIDALGHDYVWTVTTAPTETEDGIETEVCKNDPSHTRGTRTLHATGTAGLQFTPNGEGTEYTVSGYTGTATVVHIPSFYNNKPVTAIGVSAFEGCTGLTNITLNEGILSIGNNAFYGCSALNNIIIPDSVTSIGNYAFVSCSTFSEIIIPNSVRAIGEYAFSMCSNLNSITMGNNVQSIGNRAFKDLAALQSIVIPLSVTTLGAELFYNSATTMIYCEASSKPAGWDAQWNSKYGSYVPVTWASDGTMREYSFETNGGDAVDPITAYNVQNAPITGIEGYMVYGWYDNAELSGEPVSFPYFSKTNLTLYARWETQCTYIFYDEDGITELKKETICYGSAITAPANPTKTATAQYTYTFEGWDKEIPETITGNITFTAVYSQKVNKYTLTFISNGGSAVVAITQDYGTAVSRPADPEKPAYIFEGWYTDNGTFTLPYEFTNITENITLYAKWSEHPGTEGLLYTPISDEYYVTGYNGTATDVVVPLMYNGKKVVCVYSFSNKDITSIVIGGNVTSIGNDAFTGCVYLNKIIIPNSVTQIGNGAFSGCTSLNEILIPSGVTWIGESAFYGCSGLVKVTLPEGLAQIKRGLFYNCSSLSEIVMGSGTLMIDDMAFGGCSGLSKVYYKGTAEQLASVEVRSQNTYFTAATKYFYSETQPAEGGNYWHYDTEGKTPIIW